MEDKEKRHKKAIDSLNKSDLTFKDYLWMSLLIGLGTSLSLLIKW